MRQTVNSLIIISLFLSIGCSDFGDRITEAGNQADTVVYFSRDIQPIFNANCSGCHVGGNQGGLTLDNYASLMQGGDSGPVVRAGMPDSSLLVKRIEGTIQPRMPLGGQPLPPNDIYSIRRWILQGIHDN